MNGDEMVDVQIPEDADVMVFQRVTHVQITRALQLIREKGVAVVVDIDDDLSYIHPSNPAFNYLHPRSTYAEHSWAHALTACDNATMVTTATPALQQRYAKHGRGRVFDNYVPSYMLDIPHLDSDVIGWPGSVHSHPDDLQVMGPSMARLAREGHTLAAIGDGKDMHQAWGIPTTTPIHATGVIDISQWGRAVTKLGVGVAPLADTRFNGAKSWLKVAEMAAVGVPCVASPRAEYSRLHKEGVGLLAKDPKDWYRKLKHLSTNEAARRELSEQGRDVMANFTIEANAWKLAEIWKEALRVQRATPLGVHSRRRQSAPSPFLFAPGQSALQA